MKPATEMTRTAKQTDLFNRDFLKENLKDPSLTDGFLKASIGKARKLAITLGSIMIVALIAVVYAFVQEVKRQKYNQAWDAEKARFELCTLEKEKQNALALEAQMITEEANKMAEERLQVCLQSKK